MPKTYRMLAIVAVVITLICVLSQLTFTHVVTAGWFSYSPLAGAAGGLLSGFFTTLWGTTNALAAPIVATFGAVVAAQERRWFWLYTFIVLGLIGIYGPTSIVFLALATKSFALISDTGLSVYPELILQALPAVAALLFVATARRSQPTANPARA